MAQIIAKFGYLKGKSRGGYAKYIATREGVEKLDESLRDRPVTQSQQEFINKLLEDFPDSKELWEYEDYKKSPTLGSASEFISAALELHMGELSGRSGYLKYIGTRPRVEKQGSHGLFSYAGEPISLNKVAQEVDAHRGNIWTAIYSLRREDAQRLGFDTAARWRDLLRSQAGVLAQGLKIAPTHLKWYAAFHNEGHHPHVHLIAYSTKPGEGFLTKQGMGIIRSALAQEIFRQDLVSVYQRQTTHRDELRRASREKVAGLVQQISGGVCENPKLESMLRELTGKLSNVKGKKVYGYLRPELKSLVNQIVDELAKDERIAALYDLWYQDKQDARNVYDERPLERIPLSENQDFKSVRNAVIQAAIVLPPAPIFTVEDEAESDISEPSSSEDNEPAESPPASSYSHGKKKTFWTEKYLTARRAMYGDQASPPELALAVRLMKELADGNPLAAHDLGVLLLKGMGCEADENGGKLPNRAVFYCDEYGTLPKIESAEMMFSASRSRRLSIVPIIQSIGQLEKNYGKEGAEIIIDNTQDTIFGGFAPNSQTAEVMSKSLGSRTAQTGYISKGKESSQSLQMIERPLMTPDELKSMPKGQFIVMKTGAHPMKVKLKLFFEWGITFGEPYAVPDKGNRPVPYAGKETLINAILEKYPPAPVIEEVQGGSQESSSGQKANAAAPQKSGQKQGKKQGQQQKSQAAAKGRKVNATQPNGGKKQEVRKERDDDRP